MSVQNHFHIIVPVWGERYTQVFTNIILPLFIGNSNLCALPANDLDKFVIVTRWEDSIVIRNSESFKKLQTMLTVKFILIDGVVNFDNTYVAMSQCYAMAMYDKEVVPSKTYFIFLTPDCFWTSGTFKKLYELRDSGYKVAMGMGIRVSADSIAQPLLNLIHSNKIYNEHYPVEYFVNLVIDHLHPMADAMNLLSTKNEFLNMWPSNLYWINKNENQIIGHCFHMHPLMVQSPAGNIAITHGDTIDGNYLAKLNYPQESFFVLQDNYFGIDLTDPIRTWNQPLSFSMINKIIEFSTEHANVCHFNFFKHRVTLSKTNDIDPALDALITNTVKQIIDGRNACIVSQKYTIKKFIFAVLRKMKRALVKLIKLFCAGVRRVRYELR